MLAFPTLGEITRFGLVGVLATVVHYITALALATQSSPFLANIGGFLVAVGVSYFGHHKLTFRISKLDARHRFRFPRFAIISVAGLALSQVILAIGIAYLTLPVWVTLGVAVAVVPTFTFLVSRIWVFRRQIGERR